MAKVLEMIWGEQKQEYFCKGGPVNKTPDGQITTPWREPLSCPGRGAAFFTLLRRAGTHSRASGTMDPGSAAHHAASHSASKTRVNALLALRSIRGTPALFIVIAMAEATKQSNFQFDKPRDGLLRGACHRAALRADPLAVCRA